MLRRQASLRLGGGRGRGSARGCSSARRVGVGCCRQLRWQRSSMCRRSGAADGVRGLRRGETSIYKTAASRRSSRSATTRAVEVSKLPVSHVSTGPQVEGERRVDLGEPWPRLGVGGSAPRHHGQRSYHCDTIGSLTGTPYLVTQQIPWPQCDAEPLWSVEEATGARSATSPSDACAMPRRLRRFTHQSTLFSRRACRTVTRSWNR